MRETSTLANRDRNGATKTCDQAITIRLIVSAGHWGGRQEIIHVKKDDHAPRDIFASTSYEDIFATWLWTQYEGIQGPLYRYSLFSAFVGWMTSFYTEDPQAGMRPRHYM